MGQLQNLTVPPETGIKPNIALTKVLFPGPFGPITPTICPHILTSHYTLVIYIQMLYL